MMKPSQAVCWTSAVVLAFACLAGAPTASARSAEEEAQLRALSCHSGSATSSTIGRPTGKVAWRAELLRPTGVYSGISRAPASARASVRPAHTGARAYLTVGPSQASWLLVLRANRAQGGQCWVQVRLPSRPNDASGWVQASQLTLRPTAWRIVISVAKRSLSVYRNGNLIRHFEVVVGVPRTPTPHGLFSIIGAWRSPPSAFLGAWILPLTAHSDVLHEFDGGDGTIGIHGRGGASLLKPLGSASSHGFIRLDNSSIDWLVSRIGRESLAGVPVLVQ